MFFTFIHGYSENNENWIMMDADPVRYATCCTDIAIAYERSIENQTALSLPLKYRCVCFEHSLFFLLLITIQLWFFRSCCINLIAKVLLSTFDVSKCFKTIRLKQLLRFYKTIKSPWIKIKITSLYCSRNLVKYVHCKEVKRKMLHSNGIEGDKERQRKRKIQQFTLLINAF